MKFILEKILHGKNRGKLSLRNRKILSDLLVQMSGSVPPEFQRNSFPLDGLANWKATQYMFILLYADPLIFRQVLPSDFYCHFLLLHIACRILYNRELVFEKVDEAHLFYGTLFQKCHICMENHPKL